MLCVLIGVLEEARFFGIDSLIEHLEVAIKVRWLFCFVFIMVSITLILSITPNTPLIVYNF